MVSLIKHLIFVGQNRKIVCGVLKRQLESWIEHRGRINLHQKGIKVYLTTMSDLEANKWTYIYDMTTDEPARRYFEKHKINRNSREVFDATSTEETKGMIFMKDGTIALSNMKPTFLVKRANKDYPPESEKVARPAKAKSTGSKEKNFVNNNPQPPKPTAQFVDENIEEYDVEKNNFMDIFDE